MPRSINLMNLQNFLQAVTRKFKDCKSNPPNWSSSDWKDTICAQLQLKKMCKKIFRRCACGHFNLLRFLSFCPENQNRCNVDECKYLDYIYKEHEPYWKKNWCDECRSRSKNKINNCVTRSAIDLPSSRRHGIDEPSHATK